MKKEDLTSLLVYALMIAVAVIVGLCVIRPITSDLSTTNNIGLMILLVLAGIVFNVLLYEIGHVIGAKISGYKIMSFNVLGLCLYHKNNHWKFKFSNFDGLTGETKIAPKKQDPSPKLYSSLPLFLYVFELCILMIMFYVLKSQNEGLDHGSSTYQLRLIFQILAIIFVTIGGMMAIYNIFPAKLDSVTDGYRLTLLNKKENIKAFNELMRIEAAYMDGITLDSLLTFNEITDFTSSVNLYSVYKYLKEKKYEEASILLDQIINAKGLINNETYCSALAQKLYILLLTKDVDEVKTYYQSKVTANERKFISNDISMPSIRAYILISAILEISEHEVRYAMSHLSKALKRTLPGRIELEKELYEIAIAKVDTLRPEWHIREQEVK